MVVSSWRRKSQVGGWRDFIGLNFILNEGFMVSLRWLLLPQVLSAAFFLVLMPAVFIADSGFYVQEHLPTDTFLQLPLTPPPIRPHLRSPGTRRYHISAWPTKYKGHFSPWSSGRGVRYRCGVIKRGGGKPTKSLTTPAHFSFSRKQGFSSIGIFSHQVRKLRLICVSHCQRVGENIQ